MTTQDTPLRLPSAPARGIDIAALVAAFVVPLVGLILGLVGVHEAHSEGRRANGLSVAAAWLGGLFTVILVAVIWAAVAAANQAQVNLDNLNGQLSSYSACIDGQVNGTVPWTTDCTAYLTAP